MVSSSRPRLVAPGVAMLAVVGVWLTHTVEYTRLTGSARLAGGALASVHVYMLPAGALLALCAALAGVRCWRAWWALGRRLEGARAALASAWRGRQHPGVPVPPVPEPSDSSRLVALWLPLTAIQAALYLLQENVEALVAGQPLPGLGAVTGVHLPVLLVHLAVALVLACAALQVSRRLDRRRGRVAACERLLRAVLRSLARSSDAPPAREAWSPSPLDRFGRHLWRRPPPPLSSDA
jgi:hypothetical protein